MYNLGLMYELGQGMKAEPFHGLHVVMRWPPSRTMSSMPAAHRDALWGRMTAAAQKQAPRDHRRFARARLTKAAADPKLKQK